MLSGIVKFRYLILAASCLLMIPLFFSAIAGTKELPVTVKASSEPVLSERAAELESTQATGMIDLEDFKLANTRYVKVVPGGKYKLELNKEPLNANEKIYWTSSDPAVATVDGDGNISAISTGETIITIADYKGKLQRRALVEVTDMPYTILDVPYISQIFDYPNGCESVSTVMALNYEGIHITVDEFIDDYLDMKPVPSVGEDGSLWGYSPWNYFLGDPRDNTGLCCYAPAISAALDKFVDDEKYEVIELHGVPLERLCSEYIYYGHPVILWGTMYMNDPFQPGWEWNVIGEEDSVFRWTSPMHCLLMIGFDGEYYYFNDPTAGEKVAYFKSDVEEAYEGLFEQAIVVRRKSIN